MMKSKALSRLIAGAAVLGLALPAANAASYRLEQETAPNSGVFEKVGNLTAFDQSSLSAAAAYAYGVANNFSYSGQVNGLPTAINDGARIFLVETSDGLSLFMVLDGIGDGSGGSASLDWTVSGDTALSLVNDDSSEAPTTNGMDFSYDYAWASCCTDGFAIGSLDGDFGLEGTFTAYSGLSVFEAVSGDNSTIGLTLANNQSVRLSAVPVPAALPLAAAGFAGLFGANARRRRRG